MELSTLKKIFSDFGCTRLLVKELSSNDNSKNQVYFGSSFEVLNILPISEIFADSSGEWSKERFKASLNFWWVDECGKAFSAPCAQLVLYPKYPEVRFSGFLKRADWAPSDLMATRLPSRLLFLGVGDEGSTFGYVASPDSAVAREFVAKEITTKEGVFFTLPLTDTISNRLLLLQELKRIHLSGWIRSKRLDRSGAVMSCNSPNCGGYTLEAELGITPNGYSEPDYLGYELKQFKVNTFNRVGAEVITLMTPEPNGGLYLTEGVERFLQLYGYLDKRGRVDRINFGGVHRISVPHPSTGLTLQIDGFDAASMKIRNTTGCIALVDSAGNQVATWGFTALLKHWNRKHNLACYIPSLSDTSQDRKYCYGNKVIMGDGTDFQLFLKEMSHGNIYYDPAIKMENASVKPVVKRRSQFRIQSKSLKNLYHKSEIVDVLS